MQEDIEQMEKAFGLGVKAAMALDAYDQVPCSPTYAHNPHEPTYHNDWGQHLTRACIPYFCSAYLSESTYSLPYQKVLLCLLQEEEEVKEPKLGRRLAYGRATLGHDEIPASDTTDFPGMLFCLFG